MLLLPVLALSSPLCNKAPSNSLSNANLGADDFSVLFTTGYSALALPHAALSPGAYLVELGSATGYSGDIPQKEPEAFQSWYDQPSSASKDLISAKGIRLEPSFATRSAPVERCSQLEDLVLAVSQDCVREPSSLTSSLLDWFTSPPEQPFTSQRFPGATHVLIVASPATIGDATVSGILSLYDTRHVFPVARTSTGFVLTSHIVGIEDYFETNTAFLGPFLQQRLAQLCTENPVVLAGGVSDVVPGHAPDGAELFSTHYWPALDTWAIGATRTVTFSCAQGTECAQLAAEGTLGVAAVRDHCGSYREYDFDGVDGAETYIPLCRLYVLQTAPAQCDGTVCAAQMTLGTEASFQAYSAAASSALSVGLAEETIDELGITYGISMAVVRLTSNTPAPLIQSSYDHVTGQFGYADVLALGGSIKVSSPTCTVEMSDLTGAPVMVAGRVAPAGLCCQLESDPSAMSDKQLKGAATLGLSSVCSQESRYGVSGASFPAGLSANELSCCIDNVKPLGYYSGWYNDESITQAESMFPPIFTSDGSTTKKRAEAAVPVDAPPAKRATDALWDATTSVLKPIMSDASAYSLTRFSSSYSAARQYGFVLPGGIFPVQVAVPPADAPVDATSVAVEVCIGASACFPTRIMSVEQGEIPAYATQYIQGKGEVYAPVDGSKDVVTATVHIPMDTRLVPGNKVAFKVSLRLPSSAADVTVTTGEGIVTTPGCFTSQYTGECAINTCPDGSFVAAGDAQQTCGDPTLGMVCCATDDGGNTFFRAGAVEEDGSSLGTLEIVAIVAAVACVLLVCCVALCAGLFLTQRRRRGLKEVVPRTRPSRHISRRASRAGREPPYANF